MPRREIRCRRLVVSGRVAEHVRQRRRARAVVTSQRQDLIGDCFADPDPFRIVLAPGAVRQRLLELLVEHRPERRVERGEHVVRCGRSGRFLGTPA